MSQDILSEDVLSEEKDSLDFLRESSLQVTGFVCVFFHL